MNKSTFEEEIKKSGKIIYTNVGDSMMPFIRQGRDVLVISRAEGRLKRYDIPLNSVQQNRESRKCLHIKMQE